MKVTSCGLIITSPKGWLLARATGTKRWDLPKGRPEPNESAIQTALRETLEETGLDFSDRASEIIDLGVYPYIKGKDLHLFKLSLNEALDLSDCKCTSIITWKNKYTFPETDKWEWVNESEITGRVGKGLAKLLTTNNLINQRAAYAAPCG